MSHISVNDTLTPPIFQLNNDILGYIFSLNADMEGEDRWITDVEPAIVTLRYTSQVCIHWREVILGSPSLWAHVLDIELLCQRRDEWRKEVMCRTGTALLHFKLLDDGRSWFSSFGGTSRAAEWLLCEHWERIRSLELHFGWEFMENEKVWHDLLQRPAPSLEVFRFAWPWSEPAGNLYVPGFVLFSNHAPSLRTLCAANMTLDLTTFPLQNLQNLTLNSSFTAFTLLEVLSLVPTLETLEAKTDQPFKQDDDALHSSLPQVLLPRLRYIEFRVDCYVDIALSFLEHILPTNGCIIQFTGDYLDESPDGACADLYGRVLSRYSQSCTELETATNLQIGLALDRFYFGVDLFHRGRFTFNITSDVYFFPEGTISTLLSSFTMRFDNIRKLALHLDVKHQMPLNPDIINFLLALVSVEELRTDLSTLKFLQDVQSDKAVVALPSLRLLCIDSMIVVGQLWRMADFVNTRIQLGISVDMLTVEMYRPDTEEVETVKKLVPGLKVQIKE